MSGVLGSQQGRFHRFLSLRTFKLCRKVFTLAAKVKCIPVELENSTDLRVKAYTKRSQKFSWHIANLTCIFGVIFQWITFIYAAKAYDFSEETAIHLLYVSESTFGLVYMLAVYQMPNEFAATINQHHSLLNALKDLGLAGHEWYAEPFVIIACNYFTHALGFMWTAMLTFYLTSPERSCYIYSHLPERWKANAFVYIICFAYEMIWMAWAMIILAPSFCYWCAHVFSTIAALRALRQRRTLSKKELAAMTYLQIYYATFNEFNKGIMNVGFSICVVAYPVGFASVVFKWHSQMNLILNFILSASAGFCIVIIGVFITQNARIGIVSTEQSNAMRQYGLRMSTHNNSSSTRNKQLYLRKRVKALAPFGIQVWFFGRYTLVTAHEMITQVFNNILLLLSL